MISFIFLTDILYLYFLFITTFDDILTSSFFDYIMLPGPIVTLYGRLFYYNHDLMSEEEGEGDDGVGD